MGKAERERAGECFDSHLPANLQQRRRRERLFIDELFCVAFTLLSLSLFSSQHIVQYARAMWLLV
jgi:hypothetical protein